MVSPPSRQDHCAKRTVSWACNGVEWEPQSVEAPKGSMLCSGGSRFTTLDNSSLAWPRTSIGSTHTFQWTLTAFHRTATWEYFVDGRLFKTVNDNGAAPPPTVTHTLSGLPSGNHTILARWNVYDTAMAFYACMDVNVSGGSASAGAGTTAVDADCLSGRTPAGDAPVTDRLSPRTARTTTRTAGARRRAPAVRAASVRRRRRQAPSRLAERPADSPAEEIRGSAYEFTLIVSNANIS